MSARRQRRELCDEAPPDPLADILADAEAFWKALAADCEAFWAEVLASPAEDGED